MRFAWMGVVLGLLTGCRPGSACDAGGPGAAALAYNDFLAHLPSCSMDAGCAAVHNPCGDVDTCDLSVTAVPFAQQLQAEELASKLTAEDCPAACSEELDDESSQISSGNVCIEFNPEGSQVAACVAGQCRMQLQPELDAGSGFFESRCGFGCDSLQFCDISMIETACPGPPGVFTLEAGNGVCVSSLSTVEPGSCTTTEQCGEDSQCVPEFDGGVCGEAAECFCGSCEGEFLGLECPAGCMGPVEDLRHCAVCICDSCPA